MRWKWNTISKIIENAARDLLNEQIEFLSAPNGRMKASSGFFEFREKALANFNWLKSYEITSANWAEAAFTQPALFCRKPETLQAYFWSNLKWLKPYGGTSANWAKAAINQPQLFCIKPETLQSYFEANIEWLKPYGVTGQNWAKAAFRQSQLFTKIQKGCG